MEKFEFSILNLTRSTTDIHYIHDYRLIENYSKSRKSSMSQKLRIKKNRKRLIVRSLFCIQYFVIKVLFLHSISAQPCLLAS